MSNSPNNGYGIAISLGLLVLTVLLGYTFELPVIVNYLDAGAFWGLVLLAGVAGGAGIGWYVLAQRPQLEDFDRYRILAAAIIGTALLLPLLMSWSNRLFTAPATPTPVTYVLEEARFGSRFGELPQGETKANTFILFFQWNGQLHRITAHKPFFPEAEKGDEVTLLIKQGRWGLSEVVR